MLISTRCICGFMPNLHKKSWMVSIIHAMCVSLFLGCTLCNLHKNILYKGVVFLDQPALATLGRLKDIGILPVLQAFRSVHILAQNLSIINTTPLFFLLLDPAHHMSSSCLHFDEREWWKIYSLLHLILLHNNYHVVSKDYATAKERCIYKWIA